MLIKIIKVPIGSAPKWVRQNWIGVKLTVSLMPADAIKHDFITEKILRKKGGYKVERRHALDALAKKSIPATEWYMRHLPKYADFLCFETDEVKVLPPMNAIARHLD